MDNSFVIRPVRREDQLQITQLFVNDAYRPSIWLRPVFNRGLVRLFYKHIVLGILVISAAAWIQGWSFLVPPLISVAAVALMWLCQLFHFINYIRELRELVDGTIFDDYSKSGNGFYVAELGGRVVGCVGFVGKTEMEAELVRMAVSEKFQNLGIGRRLLATALERVKNMGYQKIFMETTFVHEAACIFYQKNGFTFSFSFYKFNPKTWLPPMLIMNYVYYF